MLYTCSETAREGGGGRGESMVSSHGSLPTRQPPAPPPTQLLEKRAKELLLLKAEIELGLRVWRPTWYLLTTALLELAQASLSLIRYYPFRFGSFPPVSLSF